MAQRDDQTSSRLVAKLRETTRGGAAPIGFGRAPGRKVPAFVLIVRGTDPAKLGSAAAQADVVLGRIPAPSGEGETEGSGASQPVAPGALAKALVGSAGGAIVGVEVERGIGTPELIELADAGADFVAFAPERASVDVFDISALGRIARVGPDHPDSILRGLNDLPVDAVEIELDRPKGSLARLTIYDLAELRQLVDAIRRPVIFVAPPALAPTDLKLLRETGVEALALDVASLGENDDEVRGKLTEYRAAIDKLGPPIGRGRVQEGRRVFLPAVKAAEEVQEGEEDDDD